MTVIEFFSTYYDWYFLVGIAAVAGASVTRDTNPTKAKTQAGKIIGYIATLVLLLITWPVMIFVKILN